MKKTMLCLITLIFLSVTPTFAYDNEPAGFRGLTWLTPLETLKDQMTYVSTDGSYGGMAGYQRKNDTLKLGTADISSIIYYFWGANKKLVNVRIEALGNADCNNLKDILFIKFGKGYQDNEFIERYTWLGSVTTILYSYNEIAQQCKLYMSSEIANKAMRLWSTQKNTEGAEKGF